MVSELPWPLSRYVWRIPLSCSKPTHRWISFHGNRAAPGSECGFKYGFYQHKVTDFLWKVMHWSLERDPSGRRVALHANSGAVDFYYKFIRVRKGQLLHSARFQSSQKLELSGWPSRYSVGQWLGAQKPCGDSEWEQARERCLSDDFAVIFSRRRSPVNWPIREWSERDGCDRLCRMLNNDLSKFPVIARNANSDDGVRVSEKSSLITFLRLLSPKQKCSNLAQEEPRKKNERQNCLSPIGHFLYLVI